MNGWTCNIRAKNDDFPIDFAIFTKALRTDGPTAGPTDRQTDGRTDTLSYRIVAHDLKKKSHPVMQESQNNNIAFGKGNLPAN